jgi:hypothetical protein
MRIAPCHWVLLLPWRHHHRNPLHHPNHLMIAALAAPGTCATTYQGQPFGSTTLIL